MFSDLTKIQGRLAGQASGKSLSGSKVFYVLIFVWMLGSREGKVFWLYQGISASFWYLSGNRHLDWYMGLDSSMIGVVFLFWKEDEGGLRVGWKTRMCCITSFINEV